ncbi:hypothetical protein CC77DRAFT_578912 [Alternaria alternata]|uniref:GATA-type domain-containing protein n=1 Tax=Alternaria alternata TaxID=5599 RepID=A0A177D3H8_ALTAL|nr:hypothetical protein CC77DRAFT_578912 [Alternaria alternata]OAG14046.1 hypothetical protein CC77DRAFT_578912 [Alternaria alternata]
MGDAIATGDPLRFFHRFRKADGDWIIFESYGHAHLNEDSSRISVQRGSINDGGFFITARPYPTKSAALIDSFLEHKIENLRLTNHLRELQDDGEDDSEPRDCREETTDEDGPVLGSDEDSAQENSERFRMSDSQPPERAHYVKTTQTNRIGDLGIPFSPYANSGRVSRRKKRGGLEAVCGYVCLSCGNLDSTEWRKGPNGPKTLCNACGLRWAKARRKERNKELSAFPTQPTGR